MDYRISPFAQIWNNGIFNVPTALVDKYLRLASEYQLKALLYILRNGGNSTSAEIAKALGQTTTDIDDLMEFWVEEGLLFADGKTAEVQQPEPEPKAEVKVEVPKESKRELLSAPRLTPKDIAQFTRDPGISFLLNEAQRVLGRTISLAEQEMLINMVNYYGLKVEIILMIFEFYRNEKESGKSISLSYINAMAKNWAEEGIETIADADEKLSSVAKSDRLWKEVCSITGIRHRRPSQKQREMVNEWFNDFDMTMINLAAEKMKDNIPEPKLAYMNSILKKWKKNGITSPAQVKAEQEAFEKNKAAKNGDKLQSKPSYDLEQIKKDAMDNTDIQ